MHSEVMIYPMRQEMIEAGFEEMRTAEEVDKKLGQLKGTALVFVNSVCGCAGGAARPGVRIALSKAAKKPDHLLSVFAGQDTEATEKARTYFTGYQPSSPSMALLKDGKIMQMIAREQIQGRRPEELASDIQKLLESHC